MAQPILPYDEATLMQQFRAGQEAAFSHIYRQYSQRLFFYTRKYLSSVAEAQDITSECFIKLWTNKETFPSLDAVAAFLHTAARNRCYDLLRHSQMAASKQPELLQLLSEPEPGVFQIEDLRLQLLDLISAEVEKLPAKMREIFLLSYQEGLKPAAIAERLQLNVKTVKNQRLNAVRLLKVALADHPLLFVLLFLLEESPLFFD